MQAIGDGQRTGLDICGCGGLGDGEVLGFLLDDVVAACNVLDGHPAGTSVGVVGILYRVFVCRNDLISVLEGHGRLQRIAGVGAGLDFNRGRHGFWRDLPLDRGRAGVVADTFDGQGNAVIGIGGLVAAFDIIGDSCLRPVLQRHTGDPRRLLRRVVLEFVFFQRDGCALDGLGGDLDSCGVGYGCVFLGIRSKRPFGLIAVICIRLDCAVCPCERAVDLISGVGVFHLASDAAVAQCLTIGNLACGDFAVHNGRELVLCEDVDGQGDVLIVARGDCNRNRAELSFVRAASVCFQCQLTGLAVYKGNKGANAQIGINLLVIGDRAVVTGSSQLRQQR